MSCASFTGSPFGRAVGPYRSWLTPSGGRRLAMPVQPPCVKPRLPHEAPVTDAVNVRAFDVPAPHGRLLRTGGEPGVVAIREPQSRTVRLVRHRPSLRSRSGENGELLRLRPRPTPSASSRTGTTPRSRPTPP